MTGLGRMADCPMFRRTLGRLDTIESRATRPPKGIAKEGAHR